MTDDQVADFVNRHMLSYHACRSSTRVRARAASMGSHFHGASRRVAKSSRLMLELRGGHRIGHRAVRHMQDALHRITDGHAQRCAGELYT